MNPAIDLGCSDNQSHNTDFEERGESPVPSPTAAMTMSAASKIGKSKMKETGQSTNCLSKISSQIKKPPRRKTSPVNWFPRKKVDSYLERKIKMLQEVDGMNLTLDETLGDANPHYCRVLREKIAAREAAHKAMEARKAALVEASWCRILRAARIRRKEAEALLEKAEKAAAEAFEAATAVGVIMYERPTCPKRPSRIEMSSVKGGGFTTHTVTASFETAFEVDREVAAAVKTALIRLANCPSFSKKDEFKDLLHKISQNPDEEGSLKESLEVSSECESELGSDFERASHNSAFSTDPNLEPEKSVNGTRQRKFKSRQSFEKLNMEKIVDMMLERLKGLHEDELSSLATIVATCGLNAALAEVESCKSHEPGAASDCTNNPRRMSSCGVGNGTSYYLERLIGRNKMESEIPSLDKFLVKHETKLEREVREARDHKMKEARDEAVVGPKRGDRNASSELPGLENYFVKHMSKLEREVLDAKGTKLSETTQSSDLEEIGSGNASSELPGLEKFFVKHMSKLEREVLDAKGTKLSETTQSSDLEEIGSGNDMERRNSEKGVSDVPSLDKVLLKHMSRLEREVLEAKNKRETELVRKENINSNVAGKEVNEDSLDKILVKPMHRLERQKQNALSSGSSYEYQKHQKKRGGDTSNVSEGLDKVLVKHVSRLERERMRMKHEEFLPKTKSSDLNTHSQEEAKDGLDQVLVRHKSRLEREKAASKLESQEDIKLSVLRKEAREKELNEAWGGMSLGNSMRPHLSKLEREKAAWIKAEEEERRKALKGM